MHATTHPIWQWIIRIQGDRLVEIANGTGCISALVENIGALHEDNGKVGNYGDSALN